MKKMTYITAIREAVEELGKGVFSASDIVEYVRGKYPGRWKDGTIRGELTGLCFNHPSAKHHPSTHKQAFLFYLGDGKYTSHQPAQDEEDTREEEEYAEAVISFEKDLEEYLIRSLDMLEPSLKMLSQNGRQYKTDVGIIDILALDRTGTPVVIELKVGKARYTVMGQLLSYMGWVQEKLAGEKSVRGIIIAEDFDDRLRYASKTVPFVKLKKYKVTFSFEDM